MYKASLLIIVFYVICVCVCENVTDLGDGEDFKDKVYGNKTGWDPESGPESVAEMTPTNYQKVKRYYCSLSDEDPDNTLLILFATNEWRFPIQDVNLTLAYPEVNGQRKFIITSMEVILFYDGSSSSKGYITAGGIKQDFINTEFIIPDIKRLFYQFRLRGMVKNKLQQDTLIESTQICGK